MATEHLLIGAAATTVAFGAAAFLGYKQMEDDLGFTGHTLDSLLAKNRRFHPVYAEFFSNHLPMVLIALNKMGATSDRLQQYFHSYQSRLRLLVPFHSEVKINKDNWEMFVGKQILHHNYLVFFEEEVSRLGRNGAIQLYFPLLMNGMFGELVHPLLFIGYGVEAESDTLVSQGLAYLAFCNLSLGKVEELARGTTISGKSGTALLNIIHRLRAEGKFTAIATEIKQVDFPAKGAVLSQFTNNFQHYDVTFTDYSNGCHAIADALLTFYSQTLDIYILHGITGFRALTQVLSVIPDNKVRLQALSCYWRVVLSIDILDGLPDLTDAPRYKAVAESEKSALADWEAILSRATKDEDEHVIKFVYACWAEGKIYSENQTLYHRLAAEKVHLSKHKFVEHSSAFPSASALS